MKGKSVDGLGGCVCVGAQGAKRGEQGGSGWHTGLLHTPRPRVRLQRAAGREGILSWEAILLGKREGERALSSPPPLLLSPCKVKEDLFLVALGSFPALTSCQPPCSLPWVDDCFGQGW
jgi:hypothetical protein